MQVPGKGSVGVTHIPSLATPQLHNGQHCLPKDFSRAPGRLAHRQLTLHPAEKLSLSELDSSRFPTAHVPQ